jgi:hypothetical protein
VWLFWELNFEALVSLWLKASAISGWGKSLWLLASVLGEEDRAPFNYTLAFALQVRKSSENLRVAE